MARFEMTVTFDEEADTFEVVSADLPVIDDSGVAREAEVWEEGDTLDWAIDFTRTALNNGGL